MLLLSSADVAAAVSLHEVIEAVEQAQRLLGLGQAVNSPIYTLFAGVDPAILPDPHGNFQFFSAYVGGDIRAEGIASSASCVHNPTRFGLPYAVGLQLINDITTGLPLAAMERSRLTELVTPAFSAVGAKCLARGGAETVGILGCGNQGRTHLQAFREVIGVTEVLAFDPREDVLDRYVTQMSQQTGLAVTPAACAEEVIRGSDVSAIAINPCTPIVRDEWIAPGALVIALSGGGCELHREEVYAGVDLIVMDGPFSYGPEQAAKRQAVRIADIVAEERTGRQSDTDRIVFIHSGMAVNHVAAAQRVYQSAREKGLGIEFDLL